MTKKDVIKRLEEQLQQLSELSKEVSLTPSERLEVAEEIRSICYDLIINDLLKYETKPKG